MPNTYFRFKQFMVHHDRCAMKVTTDACLFGAWAAGEMAKQKGFSKTCLDIGSGCGLLSMMIAQKNEMQIDAVEIDAEAAHQANENIAASNWKDRINVFTQDVLTWTGNGKYDCIVSNPPFYEGELKSGKKAKNVAHHDESLRLSDLCIFITNRLADDGCFFLLLPFKRMNNFQRYLQSNSLFLHQKIAVKQTPLHSPFRLLLQGGKKRKEKIIESAMSIKDHKNEYTNDFIMLLRDYYLYL